MRVNFRREARRNVNGAYSLCWEENGIARSLDAQGVDLSASGMRLRAANAAPKVVPVVIEGRTGQAFVRRCVPNGDSCTIRLESSAEVKRALELPQDQDAPDC
jgi:hypothetical protein